VSMIVSSLASNTRTFRSLSDLTNGKPKLLRGSTDPDWAKEKPGYREFYEDPEKHPLKTPTVNWSFTQKHWLNNSRMMKKDRLIPSGYLWRISPGKPAL